MLAEKSRKNGAQEGLVDRGFFGSRCASPFCGAGVSLAGYSVVGDGRFEVQGGFVVKVDPERCCEMPSID